MSLYTWTTDSDGAVHITGGDFHGEAPMLPADVQPSFESHVMRWTELAKKWGDHFRVPVHWILGMIYAESTGNPQAHSGDGGWGLMQLTSAQARDNLPGPQVLDPDINIKLGTRLIAQYCRTPKSPDYPRVLSRYNAGGAADGSPHAAPGDPWGLRETKGHILRAVRAANTALMFLAQRASDAGVAPGGVAGFVAFIFAMYVFTT